MKRFRWFDKGNESFAAATATATATATAATANRYHGETSFAGGTWVGIDLHSRTGHNDGSVRGRRYFACRHQHGVFVPEGSIVEVREASTNSTSWLNNNNGMSE